MAINVPGQFPVGSQPVGGAIPKSSSHLYTVSVICYVIVNTQLQKTTNWFRTSYVKTIINIQKTINQTFKTFFLTVRNQITKQINVNRINYEKITTNIQKTINLTRISYIRESVLLQNLGTLSRIAFDKLSTNIQKTTNINRIAWITMGNQVFQKTINVVRILPITITENIVKQINVSKISYAKILTESQKVLNKITINFPILITSNIQKTINISRVFPITLIQLIMSGKTYLRTFITFITPHIQLSKQVQLSRKISVTFSILLQKTNSLSQNITIVINSLIQKNIQLLARINSLTIIQTLVYGSAHAISFLMTIGMKELVGKQVSSNRITFVTITSKIQKALSLGQNIFIPFSLLVSKVANVSHRTNIILTQFIITGKAFTKSFLFTITTIAKSPQKVIGATRQTNIKAVTVLQKTINTTLQQALITATVNDLIKGISTNYTTNILVSNQIQKLINIFRAAYIHWINLLSIYLPIIYSVVATFSLKVASSFQKQAVISLVINNINTIITYSLERISGFHIELLQPISSRVIQVLNIFGISTNTMEIQEPLTKETSSFTAIGSSSNNSPIGTVGKINSIRGISNT